jgi:hypothetical protein
VYFVVATNLEQLGHSIRAVYGEQFDAERYLKRFFDQEYLLPTPDGYKFTEFLFERYSLTGMAKFYCVIESNVYQPIPAEQALFTVLCDSFKLGPRDQEQVAAMLQAVLLNWPKDERVHLAYLLFLIIAKHASSGLFQQIAENRPINSIQEQLLKLLRHDAVFKTKDLKLSNEQNYEVLSDKLVLDMLIYYQTAQALTCEQILKRGDNCIIFPGKIAYALSDDFGRNYTRGAYLKIASYAQRVSQAGQLFL